MFCCFYMLVAISPIPFQEACSHANASCHLITEIEGAVQSFLYTTALKHMQIIYIYIYISFSITGAFPPSLLCFHKPTLHDGWEQRSLYIHSYQHRLLCPLPNPDKAQQRSQTTSYDDTRQCLLVGGFGVIFKRFLPPSPHFRVLVLWLSLLL